MMIEIRRESYLASDYCKQELHWFAEKTAQEALGPMVGQYVRVFPVLLYNIPPRHWPEACRGTSGFRFHDAVERGFGKPLHPDQDDFTDQLCGLVDELHTVLTAIETRGAGADALDEGARSRTVFLAETSDDVRRDRRHLRTQLEKEGIEIVSGILPADQQLHHEAMVTGAMRRSKLSIHLLGALPGRPVDEERADKTYPIEQVRIGLEHASSPLVVLPQGLA